MKKYKSYFLQSNKLSGFFLVMLSIVAFSCSKKNYSQQTSYQFKSISGRPDYSDLNYWAAHPWKKDLSDSVPKPLRKNYVKDSAVDVFFIYPTTLTAAADTQWNAAIDDAVINAKTDHSPILYQASAFNEYRVFAPRYRQAHYRAFFTKEAVTSSYFETAYTDIKNAFIYYLEHYNNGRPFIIASHSQGTLHAARLLKELVEDKPLYNKLICAYLIGMPINENYFIRLPPCKDSTATGCFVSWRSFEEGYEGTYFVTQETKKSIVVNPLTWTMDTTYASRSLNKGGVLLKFNKIVKKVASAQVHKNILWVSKPHIFGKMFITTKNFHVGDINLFYINIRENVSTRVGAFWKQ
jgi:hypothetical protein